MSDCQGSGAGWGTVDGVELRILILAAPSAAERARAIAAALDRHAPTVLTEPQGLITAPLTAAKAARALKPHLIFAVGAQGLAMAAGPAASGLQLPLIVSLRPEDVSKRAVKLARSAKALLLSSEAAVQPLRALGLKQDVYIIADPDAPEDRAPYQGAIEVVFGRALETTPLDEETPASPQLVQIGGLHKRSER